METRMYKQQRKRRRIWPWLAGSLALHLLVLASLPGFDSPARCPAIMLVSLVSNAAEPAAKVVKVEPVAPPGTLQKGTPRQTRAAKSTAQPDITRRLGKSDATVTSQPVAPPTTPIITSNTSAENTVAIPRPVDVPAAAGDSTHSTTTPQIPAAPAIGGTSSGTGSQGGTADVPAPAPAKPSVDVKALMNAYGAAAAAKVQRAKFFPDAAREYDRSGTTVSVRVKIKVASNGSLLAVSASGEVPELARAAEEAVRRAAPFGSFPQEVEKSSYNFTTTLEYKLR